MCVAGGFRSGFCIGFSACVTGVVGWEADVGGSNKTGNLQIEKSQMVWRCLAFLFFCMDCVESCCGFCKVMLF